MRTNTRNAERVDLNEAAIDKVGDFTYIGSNTSRDSGTDQTIPARIEKASFAFVMLRSKVTSRKTKLRIFNINVKSALMYGSETW